MRQSKIVKFDGKEVTVKELIVSEVDGVLEKISAKDWKPHMIELLLDSPVPVEAVTISTGLTTKKLEACAPAELQKLWGEVAEVNSFLSQTLNRMVAVGREIKKQVTGSGEPSAD